MSRNLGTTRCEYCEFNDWQELTPVYKGETVLSNWYMVNHFPERSFQDVACWVCGAEYIAWLDDDGLLYDLSHRSTFNDESYDNPSDEPKQNYLWQSFKEQLAAFKAAHKSKECN